MTLYIEIVNLSSMEKTVLIYIEKNNQYLMLYRNKKVHDFNKDKYVGIGGHINDNETKEEALVREVYEETGLTLLSYEYRGIIHFIDTDYEEIMYLYTSKEYEGKIIECNEGTLSFISKNSLYGLSLWEGDRFFLNKLINNEPFFTLTLRYENHNLVEVIDEK